MTNTQTFADAAKIGHYVQFKPDEVYPSIEAYAEAIEGYAAAAAIEVELFDLQSEREPGLMLWQFQNHADALIINAKFNPELMGDEARSAFYETIEFDSGHDAAYRSTWTYHAREYLDRVGTAYRLNEDGDNLIFGFETIEAFTTFTMMRKAGYFDRKTLARIADEGPVPPGVIPY